MDPPAAQPGGSTRLAGRACPPEFARPVVPDGPLATSFDRMHRELDEPVTRLHRDELLGEWTRALVERHAASDPGPAPSTGRDTRAVVRVVDVLRERFAENVGLDELATLAGVDRFRLVRLVRRHTGLPPHALQIALRVRRARRGIESGESVATAAAAAGFADQSHLVRHVRRGTGMSPREYRHRFGTPEAPGYPP